MSLFGQDRSFLEALSAQDRRALLAEGVPRAYEPGAVMIRERDTSAYVLALLSGWAVVSVGTERGARLILALRGAGEVVGDLAAVDRDPRSATVTALGRVRAVSVSGDRFRRFLATRPHATSLIMRQLSTRLRSADVERRSLASETVLQRLAARLAELAERAGRPGPHGTVLEVPLPQHDLAAAIGATREAVAKALRRLREHDVVRTGPRQVVVTDMEELLHLARGRGPRPAGPARKSPPGV
ncbi:Crp/Fnr family transcriptional regulator [Streptomyces somaliensis]|uniref:Crp/Fnr family transcriptional regulator n=1 Tax=Streptomyces somaliensis TaxID=78355 RepID=UPI0020CF8422|nr:Crp/Fnr family transcriptional regulator [Streptomyces somaliensis]MCP9943881.1 Crp/Fnr family transcriptional regulator [Streptomyces somaliensis]MCP9962871.1 Crp/Fnr family transcriptional regulator [Streptomyces somaliensis]MCP9975711.1 Crp/Fnr family transcriptional regulator [Streptomyces somaliensis]